MNNEQEIAGRIYRDGCYALCLCKMGANILGIKGVSPLAQLAVAYDDLVKTGIMLENCYINDATRFLQYIYPTSSALTKEVNGKRWQVSKTATNPGDGWIIATNSKHFVCVSDTDEIVYNPLGKENDKQWYKLPIHSYRLVSLV